MEDDPGNTQAAAGLQQHAGRAGAANVGGNIQDLVNPFCQELVKTDNRRIWQDGNVRYHANGTFSVDLDTPVDEMNVTAKDDNQKAFEKVLREMQQKGLLSSFIVDDPNFKNVLRSDALMDSELQAAVALWLSIKAVRTCLYSASDFIKVASCFWTYLPRKGISSRKLPTFPDVWALRAAFPTLPPFNWEPLVNAVWSTMPKITFDTRKTTFEDFESRFEEIVGQESNVSWPLAVIAVCRQYMTENATMIVPNVNICVMAANADVDGTFLSYFYSTHVSWDSVQAKIGKTVRPTPVEAAVSFEADYDDSLKIRDIYYAHILHVHREAQRGDSNQYAPVIPIVQSSGTGKTRLMKEMIGRVPSYYVCLRKANSSGLPPRSPVAADLFQKQGEASFMWIFAHIVLHHALVCKSAATAASAAPAAPVTESSVPPLSLLMAHGPVTFNTGKSEGSGDEAAQHCTAFWKHVFDFSSWGEALLGLVLDNTCSRGNKEWLRLFMMSPNKQPCGPPNALSRPTNSKPNQEEKDELMNGLSAIVRAIARALIPNLEESPIHVAIDEASFLLRDSEVAADMRSRADKTTRFYEMRRTVGGSFGGILVVSILDTNSSLWNMAPVHYFDPSERVASGDTMLVDPFYALPIPPHLTLYPGVSENTDVVSLPNNRMFKYNRFRMILQSRPMFHGLREGQDPAQIWHRLSRLADEKLYGTKLPTEVMSVDETQALALFAVRFPVVPYNPVEANTLVSSHMATLLGVTGDRAFAEIGYVSEPMLAEASVRLLNTRALAAVSSPLNFTGALRHVCAMIRTGRLAAVSSPGSFGEFAASVILARAFDLAHRGILDCSRVYTDSSPPNPRWLTPAVTNVDTATGPKRPRVTRSGRSSKAPQDISPHLHTATGPKRQRVTMPGLTLTTRIVDSELQSHAGAPVSLIDFLATLHGARYEGELAEKMTDINDRLLSGLVQVLQFIPCESLEISEGMLWTAWDRRFAFMTAPNFWGCDIIIPVLLPPLSDNELPSLTAVFVEVKRRSGPVSPEANKEIVGRLAHAARIIVPYEPVVLLVMHLGQSDIPSRKAKLEPLAPKNQESGNVPTTSAPTYRSVWINYKDDVIVHNDDFNNPSGKWELKDYKALAANYSTYKEDVMARMRARFPSLSGTAARLAGLKSNNQFDKFMLKEVPQGKPDKAVQEHYYRHINPVGDALIVTSVGLSEHTFGSLSEDECELLREAIDVKSGQATFLENARKMGLEELTAYLCISAMRPGCARLYDELLGCEPSPAKRPAPCRKTNVLSLCGLGKCMDDDELSEFATNGPPGAFEAV